MSDNLSSWDNNNNNNNYTFIERRNYPTLSIYSTALQELLICLNLQLIEKGLGNKELTHPRGNSRCS